MNSCGLAGWHVDVAETKDLPILVTVAEADSMSKNSWGDAAGLVPRAIV
jgi:hypothetical protein